MSATEILTRAGLSAPRLASVVQMTKAFSNIPVNGLIPDNDGGYSPRCPSPFIASTKYRSNGTEEYFIASALRMPGVISNGVRKDKNASLEAATALNQAYAMGRAAESELASIKQAALEAEIASLRQQLVLANAHAVTMD